MPVNSHHSIDAIDPVSLHIKGDIATIIFDMPDSKVNLLTSAVMQRLDKILGEIKNNKALSAVVLVSKKKDIFIAGADIKEIEGITDPKEGEQKARTGQKILNTLEDLPMPTVAVIDGAALGGGCELALACRYRIATFNEKVKIGLPEVNLGFVPGFGGTYRMPRLLGLSEGLKMVVGGRIVSGQDALRIGLVDRLYPQNGLEQQIHNFVKEISQAPAGKRKFPKKKKKGVLGLLEATYWGQNIIFGESRKAVFKKTKGFYPAPLKAVDVIQESRFRGRSGALDIEAKTFGDLAVTDISKNLVKVFYLSEKFKKSIPKDCEAIRANRINKCGVVGAGIMGGGIAQLLSYKDMSVRLKDINYDAIALGLRSAQKVFQQAVKRRKLTQAQADVKMAKITGTLDYKGFKTCEVVIEAVIENMDIKKKIFKELSDHTSPGTILCTNTSALSVTAMANETKDPSKVVGLHFFNPVHRMPLIEIIKTEMTSPLALATAVYLAKQLGKIPIVVKDSCGFLVNRVLLGYINEGGHLLKEGGDVEEIDEVMTDFGMPMGPFTLSDEVGLDVGIKVLQTLEAAFGERFKPVEIFDKVYKAGLLGKKKNKGFYIHKDETTPNDEVTKMLPRASRGYAQDEALKRMVYVMINEAARCLQEGIIEAPDVVDVGMIMGTGFPPFRGGLLRYADHVGVEHIIEDLKKFEEKFHAPRFAPCPYLLKLKEKGRGFFQ